MSNGANATTACVVNENDVFESVDFFVKGYEELWNKSKADMPFLGEKLGYIVRLTNQIKTEVYIKRIRRQLRLIKKGRLNQEAKDKLKILLNSFEKSIVGNRITAFEFFSEKNYTKVIEDFIQQAKDFDPEVALYDISQALRNVWIMNSIQILFDKEVCLTPSIFGYSMLYPYSDNYLDDTSIAIEKKMSFCSRLTSRLQGQDVEANEENEANVYRLIERIEGEYCRRLYPEVYDSLLSIHQGQTKSFKQQRQYYVAQDIDPLCISIEKGGTSVLADGYLVKGRLQSNEADFMFGYGVFLQFIDDLQDIRIDQENHHETIFTKALKEGTLKETTNKLFHFIAEILDCDQVFKSAAAERLIAIIGESLRLMIFEAIADNRELFPREYIKNLEEYSLFSFVYYKRLKKKLGALLKENDLLLLSKDMQNASKEGDFK